MEEELGGAMEGELGGAMEGEREWRTRQAELYDWGTRARRWVVSFADGGAEGGTIGRRGLQGEPRRGFPLSLILCFGIEF
jgi:hypothetical protein